MISKNDILKMAHDVFDRSQGYRKRTITNPTRDWFFGIGLFAAVVVVGGVFNWHEYADYNALDQQTQRSEIILEKYSYVFAERASTIFKEKQTAFQALQDRPVPVTIVQDANVSTSTATTTTETTSVETDAATDEDLVDSGEMENTPETEMEVSGTESLEE